MKKMLFLTAGILIAIGTIYGSKHSQSTDYTKKIPAGSLPENRPAYQPADRDNVPAVAGDALKSKIERLRRWARGEEPTLGREAAIRLLQEWADHDAHAALDFVDTAPRFPRRNNAYAIPLAKLCRTQPREVIGWLTARIALASDRTEIAQSIIRQIGDEAPAEALELAEAPGIPVGMEFFGKLLGQVARTRPQYALQCFAQKTPRGQNTVIGSMLAYWSESNPREALAWYLGQGETDTNAARMLATGCLKSGQYSLPDMVSQLKLNSGQADKLLCQLCRDGVVLAPKALGIFSEAARQNAAEIAGYRLENSPDSTLAFVEAAVGRGRTAEVLLNGLDSWMDSDRKAALEWLQQLPDRQLASQLSSKFDRQQLMQDPQKALVAAASITNPEERKGVVNASIRRLIWDDPAIAAAWLTKNPDDASTANLYGMLSYQYLERDDAGAMNWITRLGAGKARDEALSAAAGYWAEKEIDFATVSMAAIGDPQSRQRCMFNLYRRLTQTDSTKADQWLSGQGLSAEVRDSWRVLGHM